MGDLGRAGEAESVEAPEREVVDPGLPVVTTGTIPRCAPSGQLGHDRAVLLAAVCVLATWYVLRRRTRVQMPR